MLTQLCLQNFKTWKSTGPIKLAPITVFFGVNSSGKSSLGQFLLMLRRTVDQPDRNLVFHTADDSGPIDLGSYDNYVHDGVASKDIDFSIQWKCKSEVSVTDPLHKKSSKSVSQMGFHSVVGALPGPRGRVVCKSFDYLLNPAGNSQEARLQIVPQANNKKYDEYKLVCEGFQAVKRTGRAWPLQSPTRFYGFPDQLYNYYQNVADFANLQLELERMFKSIHYLGPLRQYPKRAYTWTGQAPSDVGFQGQNTIAALLAGQDRIISAGEYKQGRSLTNVVARWLTQLGVVHDFRVVNVSKSTQSYQVRLKMHGRIKEVNLLDVGFGVSQILPVVTEAFYAPRESTIIVEQPELHLHPAVQSETADMFIEAIRAKEKGAKRNMQFLIESHSEHFLRRLQRRVAEGVLKTEDIALYFCEPSGKDAGSVIRPVQLDAYGNIEKWPENFFGDQMTDIAEMAKAGLKRRVEDTQP